MTGDVYAVLVPVDAGSVEVQTRQFRCPACAVNDEVELHGLGSAGSLDTDLVTGRGLLDGFDSGGALKTDPCCCASRDQELDEVGVERLEWAWSAVNDDRGAAGTRRDVGELEGDEATTNEQDPRREHLEVQEVGAVDQVLVAGKVQRSWTCTGGDQEMRRFVGGAADLDAVLVGEPGDPVEGVDPVAGKAVLHVLGDRIGEAVFVLHQVAPVD